MDASRTLILVNGGPGLDSQFTFRGLEGLASRSRRVVAYDQRGVGRTPMPRVDSTINTDYALDAFVADLEALRVRLGADRIDVLGHSFGALIAAAYAAIHFARVRSLTLAAGCPCPSRPSSRAMGGSRGASGGYSGEASFRRSSRRRAPSGTGPCSRSTSATRRGPARSGRRSAHRGVTTPSARSSTSRSFPTHGVAISHSARPPTAAQCCSSSAPATRSAPSGQTMPPGPFRSSRLTRRVLPLAGHFLWLESPAFLPLVRSFLDRT